jgi:hypothetical protein
VEHKERTYTRVNHRWSSTGVGQVSGTLMTYLKRKAKERNLSFELTAQQLWDLFNAQKGLCALSGEPLVFSVAIDKNHNLDRTLHTASLDRIDNNKGYTIDNVQWIHKILNHMRRQYSVADYVYWCEKVAEYHKPKAVDTSVPDTKYIVFDNPSYEDWLRRSKYD